MNTISRVSATALLLAVMPLAAAQTAAGTKEQPPPAPAQEAKPKGDATTEDARTLEAIRTAAVERRAQAVADARRATEALDRQMQRLQEQTDERWDRMNKATRTRSQATMADLRKRRNALAEWSGGMRHGSNAAWSEVRGGFVSSYRELVEAMRRARTEFERKIDVDGNEKAEPGERDNKS